MKNHIKIITTTLMIIFFTLAGTHLMAQEKQQKTEEVRIRTSAVCGMCKDRIEHDMAFEKGVKSVELDEETKVVTIGYNPKKTTPDQLRKAISAIGYDADDVKAEPVAYEKLPVCCKKDNDPH